MWSNNIIEDPGILVFNTETRHMCSYWSLSSAISISIKVISATCASIDQSYQLSIIGISNLFEIKDSGDLFLKHRSGIYYGKFKFITENIWHWLKIYPDGDDYNPESDDRPYQTKLHSHSCYDAKKSMVFVNWPRAPPSNSSLPHRFLFAHLLSDDDDRFNKSYGNCSIFVFLSHYWPGNPKSMLSFLCEIIDGENVMRNYPREREGGL